MRFEAVITKEDGNILARFPQCPGCQTFVEEGEDIEAAAREALEGWLLTSLEHGEVPAFGKANRAPKHAEILLIQVPTKIASAIRVRVARRRANLTQAQLGKLVGKAQPLIAQIEGARANPTLSTLDRLAQALDVPLKELVS